MRSWRRTRTAAILPPIMTPVSSSHGFVPQCLSLNQPRNVSPIVGINIRHVVSAIVPSMKTTVERCVVGASSCLSGEAIYLYTVTDIIFRAKPLTPHETQDSSRWFQYTSPLRRQALLQLKTRGRTRQIRAGNHQFRAGIIDLPLSHVQLISSHAPQNTDRIIVFHILSRFFSIETVYILHPIG